MKADGGCVVRVHVSALFALAHAEGIDRFFGTPRGRVGGFQSAELSRRSLPASVTLLPMRGARWPEAAIRRCEQIAHESCRSLRAALAKARGESATGGME